jgi:hypothetical protein
MFGIKSIKETMRQIVKLLFVRAQELDKKWDGGKIRDCSMVLNQLLADNDLSNRINKYINNN